MIARSIASGLRAPCLARQRAAAPEGLRSRRGAPAAEWRDGAPHLVRNVAWRRSGRARRRWIYAVDGAVQPAWLHRAAARYPSASL